MVRTLCQGLVSIPGSKMPQATQCDQKKKKSILITQARDNSLNQQGNTRAAEKSSDSEYILKVKPTEFANMN